MRRAGLFLSRLLLGAIFVRSGWDAYRQPSGRASKAANLGLPQPETAVRANGLAMVVAGGALWLGVAPRAAAAALASLLVPTTLAGHRFWEEQAPEARDAQLVQFLKNAGLLGGLLAYVLAYQAE